MLVFYDWPFCTILKIETRHHVEGPFGREFLSTDPRGPRGSAAPA